MTIGYLLILFSIVFEIIGGRDLGLGNTLGSKVAEHIGLGSFIYYEGGLYEGALYVKGNDQWFHKAFALDATIPTLIIVVALIAMLPICLIAILQIHKSLSIVTNGAHPVKPAEAVWKHLVPIYSFYWVFKWTNEVANFVTLRDLKHPMRKGLTGLSLLIGFLLGLADMVVGLTIIMLTLSYIRMRIVSVFEAPSPA